MILPVRGATIVINDVTLMWSISHIGTNLVKQKQKLNGLKKIKIKIFRLKMKQI